MITLRAHHLLCLLGFRGFGYSQEFIENLKNIHRRINRASSLIKVVYGEDNICQCCPKAGEECQRESNPIKLDKVVLLKLDIKPQEVFRSQMIYKKIAHLFESRDLDNICRGCRWLEKGWCQEGLEKLKEKWRCSSVG